MSRSLSKATGLVLLAIAVIPIAVLFVSQPATTLPVPLASCHEETDSQSPSAPNHACCLVGHNHAMLARAAVVPALQFAVVERILLVSNTPNMQARPEPALTSFDPPLGQVPLRI